VPSHESRKPILYVAPWVDIGGSDKGTIDWFRFLDRDRFAPSLITTQPSLNRRLPEVVPYADEVWELPQLMHGDEFARFIVTFIVTRGVKVVHIMNSRLAFELLPEIAGLSGHPAVVVQLHVEETDHSGYVRYVTTRYGTLVDAFSVSSQALSDRLGDYDIPPVKRRLIRTGIDAEREFCPARVRPTGALDRDRFHILFPVRLTAQKDPLLMVDVAAQLHGVGLAFQIHVIGDGDMTTSVRERVAAAGLRSEVIFHGENAEIAPWYAACDTVLLTSEYEGVPYVAYEAMAMATPLVAPRLPGLAEIVSPETGVLVSPRADPRAYAAAICDLAADPQLRRRIGDAGRKRTLSCFSLERMAAEHGALYEELLARRPDVEQPRAHTLSPEAAYPASGAALRNRRPGATPLVSVIVPCFNHGQYLDECLRSIAEQDYHPIEVIVVDDGSTDPQTLEQLARLERDGDVAVLQMPTNRGPSAARNAAIEKASGRYVLPVDADNLLLPGAVAALVEQLSSADERIGFVYPHCQFFGNRTDHRESPSYNLHGLLAGNYCDTSSLIDREVFDRGFRYPEDIVLGHEDWDLVLSLGEAGIYGEAARTTTLLYRKQGFTRSDLVDAAGVPFGEVVARRHPGLFDPASRARLKAEWNPALTVIALDPLAEPGDDALRLVVTGAARQTCEDFELVIRTTDELWPTELGRRLRRVPTALAASRAQALSQALEIARGRWVLATYGSPGALLVDPALIEKLLRILNVARHVDAVAFGEAEAPLTPFRLLDFDGARRAVLSAVCWKTVGATAPPPSLDVAGDRPLEKLALWLSANAKLQWRHLPRRDRRALAAAGDGPAAEVGTPRVARVRDLHFREASPELPHIPPGIATPLRSLVPWAPPQARLLCRHLEHESGHYFFTNDSAPPAGCRLHYILGCVRTVPLAGTRSLSIAESDGESSIALGDALDLDAPELLGFVEQAPLPLFDSLDIGRHRTTGQHVLVAGAEDPLAGLVDPITCIGYIEAYPINPRHPPHLDAAYGLVGLVRAVDHAARRHRYGAGELPTGQFAGELGALQVAPAGDCEPLWIDAQGRVFAPGLAVVDRRPSLSNAMAWAYDPLTWRNFSSAAPKLRATVRRASDLAGMFVAKPRTSRAHPGKPAGYLSRSPAGRSVALYASVHPVTGDQLLSTNKVEPHRMGYTDAVLLGYLGASAPLTGTLGSIRVSVPWATRFGMPAVGVS